MSDVFVNIPQSGSPRWKSPVANSGSLPTVGNTQGDVRQTLDTKSLFTWTGSAWTSIGGGGGSDPSFGVIQTDAGTSPTASVPTDTVTFTSSNGSVVITGNSSTDTVNFTTLNSGTVTSVAMTVPSIMSIAGSPITTSGTLAITLATETANTVFAGATSGGSATPTFRALVAADIPSLPYVSTTLTSAHILVGNGSNVATNVAMSGDISITNAGVTAYAGTVGVTKGGTGLTTLTANNVILGNGTSTPSFVAPSTSGNVLTSNGTTWVSSTPAGGSPGGSTTQLQYNNSGSFGGISNLTFSSSRIGLAAGAAIYTNGQTNQNWGIGLNAFTMTTPSLSTNRFMLAYDDSVGGYGLALGPTGGNAQIQLTNGNGFLSGSNWWSSAVFHALAGGYFTGNYGYGTITSPSYPIDAKASLATVGNPSGGTSVSFTTVGTATGYPAQGAGTNYIYKTVNSKTVSGVVIYSPTPASASVTENIDASSVTANQTINITGTYFYGAASPVGNTYKVYAIYQNGTRSFSGSSLFVQPDFTPTGSSATQNPLGGGTGYTANGQTINYTIYPIFGLGRSGSGLPASVTFDFSLASVQVNLSWTAATGSTAPTQYLIVNTTANQAAYTGSTNIIDTADWSSYSDPGTTDYTFQNNLNWTAPAHGGQVDYLVYNQGNNSAAYVGSTATAISDPGNWSGYSDPGVTNLNFQLGGWGNAADATNTYLQFPVGKPSNTYDFGGLATTLSNDDGTGWGSFIDTTTSVSTANTIIYADGISQFKNTLGGNETPLKTYAPTASSHSQDWYDQNGILIAYMTQSGMLFGNANGTFFGTLVGSQTGGSVSCANFTDVGTFSVQNNNAESRFICTGLNASNHEVGILGLFAQTNSTATTDFGGGIKFYAESDNGTDQPQAAIFSSWATATNASYNGRLYLGTFSAANSNNFKEFVRMEMDSATVPRTAWNTGFLTGYTNLWATGTQDNVGYALIQSGVSTQDMVRYQDNSGVWHAWLDKSFGNWAANQYSADVTSLGSEKLTNGTFTGSAASWTLNTGWAYSSNQVTHNANGTGTLLQTSASMATPLVIGQMYRLQFTMSGWTVGTVIPACGGFTGRTLDGAVINGNTQTIYFRASSTADLTFTPSNTARFNLDNVSLKQITAGDVDAAANMFAAGTVTATGGYVGTATNNSGAAGTIGEYISSSITTFTNAPTSTNWGDMTSISLTAGDWDVSLVTTYKLNSAVMTAFDIGISQTSGNSATGLVEGDNWIESASLPVGAVHQGTSVPSFRISLASTTTIYAKTNATYASGNPQYACRISARRMR